MNQPKQLRLFGFGDSGANEYFVAHSGVVLALERIDAALAAPGFQFLHIEGPAGSGKSELLRLAAARAGQRPVSTFDFHGKEPADDVVAAFISAYESHKASGSVLLVADTHSATNPHVTSRLAFALPLELEYPREEELYPLVEALLERRGLRLSEEMIDYLVKRLPGDPLSLSNIFARIDELSLSEGRQVNRAVVRDALVSRTSRDV